MRAPSSRAALLSALAIVAGSVAAGPAGPPAAAQAADPARVGAFAEPFEEAGAKCVEDADNRDICKPAAATNVVLADGRLLYWDALEGMEDVELSTAAEYGARAQNDQTRLLSLRGARPTWAAPTPADGGANPGGAPEEPAVPGGPGVVDDEPRNDGDLFCADQIQLSDGRILAAGGTQYYAEPGLPGTQYGVAELAGLVNARIFDPATERWTQTGSMEHGRWYPTLTTMSDGTVLAVSGVAKLIKPFYPTRPAESGSNVKQTETFNPKTATWTVNPATANRSLPLMPRVHLLPNGHLYYDAAGQTFNPSGQSYDEALWNVAASYDPVTKSWTDLGIPGLGTTSPGFRGSTFSIALPLKPPYTKAAFLSAGGVSGVSPGTATAIATATINTVDVSGATPVLDSRQAGSLNHPRWYSTGVALPTGEVLAVNGSSLDEVVAPGSGVPVRIPELYDPVTDTWTEMAEQTRSRTYHNTAVLLPDARVLVGGHAPINTGYAYAEPTGEQLGLSPAVRDPSFEIFSPPYLFKGPRPVITSTAHSLGYGTRLRVSVTDAASIESVVLVRNPALTHLVDGDQRIVSLPIVARDARSVTVATPPTSAVAPAGPYLLFANRVSGRGLVPSVSRQVFVGAPVPASLRKVIADNTREAVAAELAARRRAGSSGGGAAPASPAPRPVPAPVPVPDPVVAPRPRKPLAGTGATGYVAVACSLLALAGVVDAVRRRVTPTSAPPGG
ncbi:MAG TPA: galactose oxidase early set domain-containing protein [Mycobacteriales bacterium]|nr:galactose oxidase early set domain-containing protein [Mycobacteriales bacterium]